MVSWSATPRPDVGVAGVFRDLRGARPWKDGSVLVELMELWSMVDMLMERLIYDWRGFPFLSGFSSHDVINLGKWAFPIDIHLQIDFEDGNLLKLYPQFRSGWLLKPCHRRRLGTCFLSASWQFAVPSGKMAHSWLEKWPLWVFKSSINHL